MFGYLLKELAKAFDIDVHSPPILLILATEFPLALHRSSLTHSNTQTSEGLFSAHFIPDGIKAKQIFSVI